jgi:hypothetical protein
MEFNIDPPKLDLYFEGYELTIGKVRANSQPNPIDYRSAVAFLTDPPIKEILDRYHSLIVGKFLWNEWTFDLDLNLYFEEYDDEKFEKDFYVLHEYAINKHKILIDISLMSIKHYTPDHLPQKVDVVYNELTNRYGLSDNFLDDGKTIVRYIPREVKIGGIPQYTVVYDDPSEYKLHETSNTYISLIDTKIVASQKSLNKIYNSTKPNLMHSLLVDDFLNMTEEQFNKIKNY